MMYCAVLCCVVLCYMWCVVQVKCALDVHRSAKVMSKADTALVCRVAGRVEDLLNAEQGIPAGTKIR
jgi:hypothetical protein